MLSCQAEKRLQSSIARSIVEEGTLVMLMMIIIIDDDNYIVYCYDPSYDKWTTLPPLPVKFFGLGQVKSKLVAFGRVRLYNSDKA